MEGQDRFTNVLQNRLSKIPKTQLDELEKEWDQKYAGSEVLKYLMWLLEKVRAGDT